MNGAAEALLENEPAIRLGVFAGVLLLMLLWEAAAPRRPLQHLRLLRWGNNFALLATGTLITRLAVPVLAVALASTGEANGWGLFHALSLPFWLALPLGVILLDLAIYLQHRLFHAVPWLWRLHRVHHADPDIDASTALRFHPAEILISLAIKLALVRLLGPPVLAVLIFEVLLNATAMFNHANIALPAGVDRWLRRLIVTPDMHRVHHSRIGAEMNRNFGFNLSIWDRLLGTWQDQPAHGHISMNIGLAGFEGGRELWLDRMLLQPFRSEGQSIPGGEWRE